MAQIAQRFSTRMTRIKRMNTDCFPQIAQMAQIVLLIRYSTLGYYIGTRIN